MGEYLTAPQGMKSFAKTADGNHSLLGLIYILLVKQSWQELQKEKWEVGDVLNIVLICLGIVFIIEIIWILKDVNKIIHRG